MQPDEACADKFTVSFEGLTVFLELSHHSRLGVPNMRSKGAPVVVFSSMFNSAYKAFLLYGYRVYIGSHPGCHNGVYVLKRNG